MTPDKVNTDKVNTGYYGYKKDDETKKQFYENVLKNVHHNPIKKRNGRRKKTSS